MTIKKPISPNSPSFRNSIFRIPAAAIESGSLYTVRRWDTKAVLVMHSCSSHRVDPIAIVFPPFTLPIHSVESNANTYNLSLSATHF